MQIRYYLAASATALCIAGLSSTAAFAQSTGSVDFEEEIVVTGTLTSGVDGFQSPDTTKAKSVLTQEVIGRQNPGQTILDTINLVPGVSFQNNDAYGSSGGQLTIRGFSADRISLTFDGVPLNDSGNYAIYSSQQLDPELIEQVNVNLGSTDVDSPTASASGSTVNYRTRKPSEELGALLSGSIGEYKFYRIFGMIDTGSFTSIGTRAFISASKTENDNPFNNYGRVKKQQYNARIYQPIGSNGDFVSIAGNYNQSRNNFFGSVSLRNDLPVPSGFPQSKDDREYDIDFPCTVSTVVTPGVADTTNNCGSEFDRRYNPSNTGSIRGSSKFSIGESVTLTVDPSYQYVKANGGGTVVGRERLNDIDPVGTFLAAGYIGGRPYFGRDLNGDGDLLDEVRFTAPSQTQTHRYGLISSLRWTINDQHSVRIAYTFDRARHRQTGQVGLLQADGEPEDVFPVNDPQLDANGIVLQKRDRLSYAILHQVAGEYRGEFLDEKLTVNAGIRAPFFKRNLNNNCFTTSASGFVDCFGTNTALAEQYAGLNPTVQGPQQRILKYDDILPNLGLVYNVSGASSVFANYSKGLQVPGTDALYNSFFFAPDTASARPEPETTDNFDLGYRFRSNRIQAQISAWYTRYQNRLASAYDPETERTVYRNLGRVDKYGIDGSIAFRPIDQLSLYVFGSVLESDIKDDVQSGTDLAGDPVFFPTSGKREGGSPKYSYGTSARGQFGPFELGVTAKRTGPRYIYDTNEALFVNDVQVFSAKTPAYWLVNLDARFSLEKFGMDKTFIQFNVYNLFDKNYVGSFTGGLSQDGGRVPFAQIGAPRTVSGTVVIGF